MGILNRFEFRNAAPGWRNKYFDMGKGDSDAPDYTPVAQASEEAARIAAALGEKQLAESQRQYDLNYATAKPVVDAQTELMKQTTAQGDDYYNYLKTTYRPIEQNLAMESMGLNADEMAQVQAMQAQEQKAYQDQIAAARTQYQNYLAANPGRPADTSVFADVAVPDAKYISPPQDPFSAGLYANPIEYYNIQANPAYQNLVAKYGEQKANEVFGLTVGNQADIDKANETNALYAKLREGLGMATTGQAGNGIAFEDFAAGLSADNSGSQALMQRLSTGALDRNAELMADKAMADARQGTTAMQNQIIRQGLRYGYSPAKLAQMAGSAAATQGLGLASAANQAREKEKLTQYAKKMDAVGLSKGLTGASQGAYGLALNSGNSAVNNQMQPGNQLLTGMNQAAGTTMNGQQLQLSGLGSILNAQTSIYNNSSDSGLGGILAGLGGIGQGLGAMKLSDRRMKENIVEVGQDEATGLNLYEFNYLGDPDHRFRGVMADEVESVVPDAVVYDELGFASVNYGMLGIKMEEV